MREFSIILGGSDRIRLLFVIVTVLTLLPVLINAIRGYYSSTGWKRGLPQPQTSVSFPTLSIKKVHLFTDGSAHITANMAINPDFTFKTYTEAEGELYMRKNCPDYVDTFTGLRPIAFKADVFRLCALYTEGGVYSDDDLLYLKPLRMLLETPRSDLLLVYDRPYTGYFGQPLHYAVFNAFMVAFKPKLNFFKCALDLISDNVRNKVIDFGTSNPWVHVSGPQILWHCLEGTEEFRWLQAGDDKIDDLNGETAMLHKVFKLSRDGGAHYSSYDPKNATSIYA